MILFAAVFVFTFLFTYAIAFRHHPMLEPITEAVANLWSRLKFDMDFFDEKELGLGVIARFDDSRIVVGCLFGQTTIGVTYERV